MKSRDIRRKERMIDTHEAIKLLQTCEYGVLSTIGEDGQPYGVPLNYIYKDNRIYFHSALTGHKIENIENMPKVSFCVVGRTKVLPEKFSTAYESAIAFGTATEVQDTEKDAALLLLLKKYSSQFLEEGRKYIDRKGGSAKVIRIDIQHLSGKARR